MAQCKLRVQLCVTDDINNACLHKSEACRMTLLLWLLALAWLTPYETTIPALPTVLHSATHCREMQWPSLHSLVCIEHDLNTHAFACPAR